MPKSALPKGYQLGPDNQSWLMRLKKKIQFALAAGPRAEGFWKWREVPITLFKMHGGGDLRYENSEGTGHRTEGGPWLKDPNKPFADYSQEYLSRIQPWCRWHISLNWPLFFNCHLIYCQKNVAVYPTYKSDFGITKMITFGIGFKRDSDRVYWLTANLGGNFE